MNKILYVLRRRSDDIPRTLFHASDAKVDVVFIEGTAANTISYDDLVRKIFETDRTIVI
jgi:hypothetical protein